ncbi:MAG: hypothetical protein ACI4C1_00245 [Lachnospiraceae bacterium]
MSIECKESNKLEEKREKPDLQQLDFLAEREELCCLRLTQIQQEYTLAEPFLSFFQQTAGLLCGSCSSGKIISYENEMIATEYLGNLYGKQLSLLYGKLLEEVQNHFGLNREKKVIFSELLIEIYNLFEDEFVSESSVYEVMYWFFSDYSELLVQEDVQWLLQGIEPPLENRIWRLYADRKYKERYLQALTQYLYSAQFLEHCHDRKKFFFVTKFPAICEETTEKKMALMLKMKEERNQILVQFNENNF